jgi:cation:H+ antiporter
VTGTRIIFRYTRLSHEAGRIVETTALEGATGTGEIGLVGPLRPTVMRFIGASLVILVSGPTLAASAKALAEATGPQYSFVGTLLVGLATSLPELVTSLTAVRLQAYDLAVGNLYGSNAFSMVLLAPLDLAYTDGPILGALDTVHALTGLVSVVLMAIGLAALVYRAKGRFAMLQPSGIAIVIVYVLGLLAVYLGGRSS